MEVVFLFSMVIGLLLVGVPIAVSSMVAQPTGVSTKPRSQRSATHSLDSQT